MSEPVEDRSELNEAKKRGGELLVTGADAAMAFDPAEEVFDPMAAAVVSAMKRGRPSSVSLRRNADAGLLAVELSAERIGIEALVCDRTMPAQTRQQGFDRMQVVSLASGQTKGDGATSAIHDGCELGVDTALGAPDGLGGLPTAGIRAVLMQLDMRAVEVPQFALCARGDQGQHASKQSRRAPASEASVNRTPRTEAVWQVSPWNPCAQNVEDRGDHDPVVFRRPAPARPPAGFWPRTVNFFSPSHTGSGSSHRSMSFMRALRSSPCFTGSIDFENTP